jgi:hypothetical protein
MAYYRDSFTFTLKVIFHVPFTYVNKKQNYYFVSESRSTIFLKSNHSWSRALLENPPIVQLLENFPAFYGTRRFITAFT